jgi:hypothetical protein
LGSTYDIYLTKQQRRRDAVEKKSQLNAAESMNRFFFLTIPLEPRLSALPPHPFDPITELLAQV